MRCPKCGYNSFDHLDSCKKCGKDLVEFKQSFGIKSVLFPGKMGVAEAVDEVEFDSASADAAVSAATGSEVATAAVSVADDELKPDETDSDDFGFDFMGDSTEDDDLSFDELFEEAPVEEDIEETLEAPKQGVAESEPVSSDEFAFDLPDDEAELEDSFGFDPLESLNELDSDDDFSFDDDLASDDEPESSGSGEGPKRPFDLPESSPQVRAPEVDPDITKETTTAFAVVEDIDAKDDDNIIVPAIVGSGDLSIPETSEPDSFRPANDEPLQQNPLQEQPVMEESSIAFDLSDSQEAEDLPTGIVTHHEDVHSLRPSLWSCFGAFIVDTMVLAAVGISFIVVAEAAMSTAQSRLFPSLETLIDLSVPYFLVLFFLAFGYFTLFHFLAGQTPGKMLFRLRVEAIEGDALIFSQAFLRSVGGLLQLIPVGLGYLLLLRSSTPRGWNDQLAGTRVVIVRD